MNHTALGTPGWPLRNSTSISSKFPELSWLYSSESRACSSMPTGKRTHHTRAGSSAAVPAVERHGCGSLSYVPGRPALVHSAEISCHQQPGAQQAAPPACYHRSARTAAGCTPRPVQHTHIEGCNSAHCVRDPCCHLKLTKQLWQRLGPHACPTAALHADPHLGWQVCGAGVGAVGCDRCSCSSTATGRELHVVLVVVN